MTSPERLVVVVGTGTGVGKTWMAAHALAALRAGGVHVAARKPIQTFSTEHGPTDAEVLARATGERVDDVCPRHRWYPVALAPPMAAEALGQPAFRLADLAGEIAWPSGVRLGLVELVGGLRSPIADDGDSLALARLLRPHVVVVVASAALGVLNDVGLAVEALTHADLHTDVAVALNHFDSSDDVHRGNAAWLAERMKLDVVIGATGLADRLAAF